MDWPKFPYRPEEDVVSDDAPVVLLAHPRPDRLGGVHRAHDVHIQYAAEIIDRHFYEGTIAQDAGVVHRDVDAAEFRTGMGGHGFHVFVAADVAGMGDGLSARPAYFLGDRLGGIAQVIDHDTCAVARQRQGVRAAQPAAGARHDGHAFLQTVRHGFPWFRDPAASGVRPVRRWRRCPGRRLCTW